MSESSIHNSITEVKRDALKYPHSALGFSHFDQSSGIVFDRKDGVVFWTSCQYLRLAGYIPSRIADIFHTSLKSENIVLAELAFSGIFMLMLDISHDELPDHWIHPLLLAEMAGRA